MGNFVVDGAADGARVKAFEKVRWTRELREAFLAELAGSCNVTAAAQAAGISPFAAYRLRQKDAAFAKGWGEALALGYEMLETRLVGQALAGDSGEALADGLPPVAVELALKLLTFHRNAVNKPKLGAPRQYAKPEETDKAILAKLDQIERRRAKLAAEDAAAANAGAIGAAS